jgi:hypothetical protein
MTNLPGRRKRKSRLPGRDVLAVPAALAGLALLVLIATAAPASAQDESIWVKPRAGLQAEFGIDSLQRKFYHPVFSFSWPLAVFSRSRALVDLSYLERMSGSLKGAIDFWIRAGFETRLSESVSFEARFAHFCRHLTSVFNPDVLDLNELVGRLWVRERGLALGLGFGPFVGGTPGFSELMVVDFNLSGVILPELSLESELKWVNFGNFYYDAGLAVGLATGAAVFLRVSRHYDYPTTTYIGVRLGSAESGGRVIDSFDVETGYYPYYGRNKLLVLGGLRLRFLEKAGRRFFVDVDFRTPLLHGTSLFAQFWPDRMLYAIGAQYERSLAGSLFGAWYARYDVDVPVDKPIRFRSSLATGFVLRNQSDFNRLDKRVRFEVAAGYDFTFDYDVRLRLGAQTRPRRLFPLGAEFRVDANSERRTVEFKAFASFGKAIEVRPFVGVRKISYLAGPAPPPEHFLNRVTVGVALYTWF